jgi:hypothetical protein
MPTTISNNGASIKIDNGVTVRNIMKNQIIEVSVVKTNIIKIDIGQGPLNNVFIPYSVVTNPDTATPADLRDAINDFMANSVNSNASGGATEAKQDTQISKQDAQTTKLTTIDTATGNISTKVNSIDTAAANISTKVNSIDTKAAAIDTKAGNMDNSLNLIRGYVLSLDSKIFYDPVIVDETNPNIVYYGYLADPSDTTESSSIWAILRVTNDDGIKRYKWADGNKFFFEF